jgi:hypothetical protein
VATAHQHASPPADDRTVAPFTIAFIVIFGTLGLMGGVAMYNMLYAGSLNFAVMLLWTVFSWIVGVVIGGGIGILIDRARGSPVHF